MGKVVIKAPSFDVLILGEKKFDIIKKETKSRGEDDLSVSYP